MPASEGAYRVAGTRVSLDSIVYAFSRSRTQSQPSQASVSAVTLDTARAYEQALEAYRQRRFREALERFSALRGRPSEPRPRRTLPDPPREPAGRGAGWTHVARER